MNYELLHLIDIGKAALRAIEITDILALKDVLPGKENLLQTYIYHQLELRENYCFELIYDDKNHTLTISRIAGRRTTGIPDSIFPVTIRARALLPGSIEHIEQRTTETPGYTENVVEVTRESLGDFLRDEYSIIITPRDLPINLMDGRSVKIVDNRESLGLCSLFPPILKVVKAERRAG